MEMSMNITEINPSAVIENQKSKDILPSQIEVIKDESGKTIEVNIQEDGRKINMSQYLPENVIFIAVNDEDFKFYPGDPKSGFHPPKVVFPPEELDTVKGRLALLHEIGHRIKSSRENYRQLPHAYILQLISRIASRVRDLEGFDKLDDFEKESIIMAEYKKTLVRPTESQLTSAIQTLATEERVAWAEALGIYRKLKQEGVNILGDVDLKTITDFINGRLTSYQNVYEMFTSKDQIKLFFTNRLIKKP